MKEFCRAFLLCCLIFQSYAALAASSEEGAEAKASNPLFIPELLAMILSNVDIRTDVRAESVCRNWRLVLDEGFYLSHPDLTGGFLKGVVIRNRQNLRPRSAKELLKAYVGLSTNGPGIVQFADSIHWEDLQEVWRYKAQVFCEKTCLGIDSEGSCVERLANLQKIQDIIYLQLFALQMAYRLSPGRPFVEGYVAGFSTAASNMNSAFFELEPDGDLDIGPLPLTIAEFSDKFWAKNFASANAILKRVAEKRAEDFKKHPAVEGDKAEKRRKIWFLLLYGCFDDYASEIMGGNFGIIPATSHGHPNDSDCDAFIGDLLLALPRFVVEGDAISSEEREVIAGLIHMWRVHLMQWIRHCQVE